MATDRIRDGRLDQHGADAGAVRRRHIAVQCHRRQRTGYARDSARQREHGRGAGLTASAPIDQAFLLANNPGRTIQQIDNALIPRLGRPMFEVGDKDRYNGVVSLEFRPSDDLHCLRRFDVRQEGERSRPRRHDVGRAPHGSQGGRIIPTQLQVDRENCANGCVVTSGDVRRTRSSCSNSGPTSKTPSSGARTPA